MFYNPLDKFYKSTSGAAKEGETTVFRAESDTGVCSLAMRKDGEADYAYYPMFSDNGTFKTEIKLSKGLYFYHFELGNGNKIGCGEDLTGVKTRCPSDFQFTVYDKNFSVPKWLNGGVIYQIFPDRFNKSGDFKIKEKGKVYHENTSDTPNYLPDKYGKILNNDFFGGNIDGIIEKLDYLKGLGVSAIYLNPIFKAYSNHRYDIGDYYEIDPLLGNAEDFERLIAEAEKKDIKIILDGVFNHVGDDSLYFNKYGNYDSVGAYQSKKSPYYSWFCFDNYPDEYKSWWGITTLPTTDKESGYADFIAGKNGVIDFYAKKGIGGFRLDVVDELPDKFVGEIRKALKGENNESLLIGEVWEDASNKISYDVRRKYFVDGELDSVMNYPLKNAILNYVCYGDSGNLSLTVKTIIDHYPKDVVDNIMNILSTHDTVRALTAVSGIDASGKSKFEQSELSIRESDYYRAVARLKIAVALQYTLPGVPSVYYGDEVGMEGFDDPFNRRFYPWGKENKDILSFYIKLGEIRKKYSAFKSGEYEEIYSENGGFVFKRFDENSEILICVNSSESVKLLKYSGTLKSELNDAEYEGVVALKPFTADILTVK